MDYVTPQQAKAMRGLRLVLSAGVPGPWGEAAKSVFHVHDVDFVPVAQTPLEKNSELVEWTGIRNAPIAVYNEEVPVSSWLDILMLAERLGSDRTLLPETSALRAECIGISHELTGKWGFGWCRRLSMLHTSWSGTAGDDLSQLSESLRPLQRQYEVYPDRIDAAPARIQAILDMLTERLDQQKYNGSQYLVGDRLSAADVHWACFSAMLEPIAHEYNPMPEQLRALYENTAPNISEDKRSVLIGHRDFIYQEHLRLPIDF